MTVRSNRWHWSFVAAAAVFCCVVATALPALAYTLTGTVKAAVGGAPVAGVELQLWKYDSGSGYWLRPGLYTESGADGSYTFNFSDAGVYRVQAYNHPDYAEQWWNKVASPDLATGITVPGDALTGIDFELIGTSVKEDTALSLSAPSTCGFRSVTLSGSLMAGLTPVNGRSVEIQTYSGGGWGHLGNCVTDALGNFTYKAAPSAKTLFKAVFAGDAQYEASSAQTVTVNPCVRLSRTTSWITLAVNKTYYAKGYIEPKHSSADAKLVVKAYKRRSNGTYAALSSTPTKTFSVSSKYIYYSSSKTKYQIPVKLTSKGYWKLVVYHKGDSKNAATYGSADYVRVK